MQCFESLRSPSSIATCILRMSDASSPPGKAAGLSSARFASLPSWPLAPWGCHFQRPAAPAALQSCQVIHLAFNQRLVVLQERLKGLVQLSAGTTFQDFQQQLGQRVGLPPSQLQVVIACSRANEFDQLQKIPIHEGTVRIVRLRRAARRGALFG